MTPKQLAEIQAAARHAARTSAAAQGLPPKITDPATINKIAALLRHPAQLEDAA